MTFVRSRFGTLRGAVRLALAYGEVAAGRAAILPGDPDVVRRLVFVCQGNICRSAFAEVVGRNAGFNVASFGLSTEAAKPAHAPAVAVAAALGVDLGKHRTSRVEDYVPIAGDLLLAMETRQLRRLARDPRLDATPRTLLGLYAKRPVPHLHDPFELDDDYMAVCLSRIADAVANLGLAFPAARSS
jgi:protein-tyrosine phosphatase